MVARKASTLCYNNQHLNLIPIVIVSLFFFFDLVVTVAIVDIKHAFPSSHYEAGVSVDASESVTRYWLQSIVETLV